MVLRWIIVLKVASALLVGGLALGTTAACGTIEGIGKDISALGRAGKRAFE
jgi:predicted small secreted protein